MEDTKSSLICKFSDQKCSSADWAEELFLHLKWHNVRKPYICNECDQVYIYKGAFKRHLNVHLKENLFSCSNCNVILIDEINLAEYSKIHINTN